jgi:hypothetical protein
LKNFSACFARPAFRIVSAHSAFKSPYFEAGVVPLTASPVSVARAGDFDRFAADPLNFLARARLGVDARGEDRETLLRDYVQLISGQGVPPARMSEWRAIYAAAGCRLAHVIEDTATTRFIHVVMLLNHLYVGRI